MSRTGEWELSSINPNVTFIGSNFSDGGRSEQCLASDPMAVVDALARLLPGSLADDRSSEEESFAPALEGALEYPHYTRPADWRGHAVPEVLLSGHHARIEAWRREQASAREADGRAR